MRLNIIILIITILLGATLTFWLDKESARPTTDVLTTTKPNALSGELAPAFSFKDINGKEHSRASFSGKTVILNFWASWCAPCVVEFPKLMTLAKDNPRITLIALSSDSDDLKVRSFIKRHAPKSDNVIIARDDKRHITADIFNTYKLPETLIISPSGIIARKIVGDTDWNGKEIKDFLSTLK